MRTPILKIFSALSLLFIMSNVGYGQCPNNNNPYGFVGNLAPGQSSTVFCMYGGEFATVQVESGATYTFSTCGGGSFDTQLTLYSSTGTYLAYNDDFCGLQSQITWTSTFTGSVRVVLDRYFCSSQFSCMNMTVTRSNSVQTDPCDDLIVAQCDNSYSYSLSGSGAWNPPGPWGTPGAEQVYEFTPTLSGVHTVNISNSGFYVDLFIKANNCGPTGWTYVDDIFSSGSNSFTLSAGTTYYFLVDDENTSLSTGTFSIDCPNPAVNPCNNITDLTCDVSESFSLSGSGAWNPPGPWGTPGEESVFSYTPSITGNYDVNVTNSGFYVDLFFKSTACGPNGWTYLDDIFSSGTSTVFLTAGTTYLFLIDDENTSPSSGTITVECPCIGNQIDDSFTLSGNQVYSGNTQGACDDCSFRSSEDIVYEFNIPCAGTYTFETCNLASWDTYLYLSANPCSGILAFNDDNCGLRSRITYTFSGPGTYYLTVEGFSSSSAGPFGLSVSRVCDLSASLSSPDKGCGYNLTCSNSSDGEVNSEVSGSCGNVNYTWSNGASSSDLSGLDAGSYSLSVSDDWGCSASSSITLTAPPAVTVNAGGDQVVYYGYTPMSCADLQATGSGGCGNLSYEWFANGVSIGNQASINVCPSTSTTYTVVATDQNGCSSSDDVEVCVVDVTCYAGNSNVQKVEVCHIPPGNPGNAHTICINENAVQDHLDHGCQLGACGEALQACGVTNIVTNSGGLDGPIEQSGSIEESIGLNVFPNPFDQSFNIQIHSDESGTYQINLIDVSGRTVMNIMNGYEENMNRNYRIDNNDLSPGTYLLKVALDGNVVITETVVKQ